MATRVGVVNFVDNVHGDTFTTRNINFFEADGTTPLDLSSTTPRIEVRRGSWTGKLMETSTIGDGLTWADQSSGQLQWGGFDIDWGSSGDFYYDLQITYTATSIVRTYLRGKVVVIDEVTTATGS
jgi:hypothetical protein